MIKREEWLKWTILEILTLNLSIFFLANRLDLYEDNAWYTKWYIWLISIICGFIPFVIILFIFNLVMTIKVCQKLNVPGEEIYAYPYAWILCFITPFLGWTLLIILFLYVHIFYLVKIYEM